MPLSLGEGAQLMDCGQELGVSLRGQILTIQGPKQLGRSALKGTLLKFLSPLSHCLIQGSDIVFLKAEFPISLFSPSILL